MNIQPKKQFSVKALSGYPAEVAHDLWAMEETRRRTKRTLEGIDAEILHWKPQHGSNSIATLLYHIAFIEMDWLFVEILQQDDRPPAIAELFPGAARDDAGRLTQIEGETLDQHLHRLDVSRAIFLSSLLAMTVPEYRRPREFDDYIVTPEWILHHLMQHEAEHRVQIGEIRVMGATELSGGAPY